jgi:hypothetical protein
MSDFHDGIHIDPKSGLKLNRAKRRQLKKLADKVDRITQADRRFFERFPHRQHRIRLASQAEIEQQALLDGKPPFVPPGYHLFAIIRNVSPGYRLRLFAPGPPSVDTDAPEDIVRGVWEAAATPKVWEIEAQTRKMAERQT